MNWFYEGKEFNLEDFPEAYGFVYLIIHKETGLKYIGRKFFTSSRTKQIKGVKKKTRIESDWKKYYGSSPAIKRMILAHGKDAFFREILHICYSISECKYFETKEIFIRDALIDEIYINEWVTANISSRHLAKLIKKRG